MSGYNNNNNKRYKKEQSIRSPIRDNFDASSLQEPSGYICAGEGCGARNVLNTKDSVRCAQCGYRILYKRRQRRPIAFISR